MKKVLKKFNRTLSIMLAAAMVLTMVPQTAMPVLAAENEVVEAQTEAPAEDSAPVDENNGDEESADVGKTGETPEIPADDEQKEEDPKVDEDPSGDNETPVIDPDEGSVDDTEVEEPVEDPAGEVVDPTIDPDLDPAYTINSDVTPQADEIDAPEVTITRDGNDVEVTDSKAEIVRTKDAKTKFAIKSPAADTKYYYTIDDTKPTKDKDELVAAGVEIPDDTDLTKGGYTFKVIAIKTTSEEGSETTTESAATSINVTYKTAVYLDADSSADATIKSGDDTLTEGTGYVPISGEDLVLTVTPVTNKEVKAVEYKAVTAGSWTKVTASSDGTYKIPKARLNANLLVKATVVDMRKFTVTAAEGTAYNMFTVTVKEGTKPAVEKEITLDDNGAPKDSSNIFYATSQAIVKVTITGAEGCTLGKVKHNSTDKNPNKNSVELSIAINDSAAEQTIEVTASEKYNKAVVKALDADGNVTGDALTGSGTAGKNYSVDFRTSYQISATMGNSAKAYFIGDARCTTDGVSLVANTKPSSGESGETGQAEEPDGTWTLSFNKDTVAGKNIVVKLYQSADDAANKPVDTLNFAVSSVIKTVAVGGTVKVNGKSVIKQELGVTKPYKLTVTDNKSTDKLIVKVDDPGKAYIDEDSLKAEKTGTNWTLSVTTKAAEPKEEAAATISIYNEADGESAKALAEVPVIVTPPAWNNKTAPTVKLAGSTDIDLNLDITLPNNAQPEPATNSAYYYKIDPELAAGTDSAAITGVKYYPVTTDKDNKTFRQDVQVINAAFGAGHKAKFNVEVTLVQTIAKSSDTGADGQADDTMSLTKEAFEAKCTTIATSSPKKITCETKDVYHSEKLTLKKAKAASGLYTGETNVVATVGFDKLATYTRDADVKVEVLEKFGENEPKLIVVKNGQYDVKNGEITLKADKGLAPGKYKIRVTQTEDTQSARTLPNATIAASATMDVTVVKGIETINASNATIYVNNAPKGKDGKAKIVPVLNGGVAAQKPKTAKVTYTLGTVENDEFNEAKDGLKYVTLKQTGEVVVSKTYSAENGIDKFAVKITPADFTTRDTAALKEVEKVVTFTIKTTAQGLGDVVLVKEKAPANEGEKSTYEKVEPNAEGKYTADALTGVYVRVLQPKDETVGQADDTALTAASFVDKGLYTLTTNKKNAIDIATDGKLTVKSIADGITVDAATTDGGNAKTKANKGQCKFSVTYAATSGVKLQIKSGAESSFSDFTNNAKTLEKTPTGEIISVQAVGKIGNAETDETLAGKLVNYKVKVDGATVVKKESNNNLDIQLVMTKETATLTLTDQKNKAIEGQKYTITNVNFKDFEQAKAPSISMKAKTSLYSMYGPEQTLTFTVGKWDAKKVTGYETIAKVKVTAAADDASKTLYGLINETDKTVAYTADTKATTEIPLKVSSMENVPVLRNATLYFDFLTEEGDVVCQTSKAVKITTKLLTKSFKLTDKYTMSVKDQAEVTLGGKRNNVSKVEYGRILNANIKGRINAFTTAFGLDKENGKLRLLDEKYAEKKYKDETYTKEIDNTIGFIEYTVTYDDGSKQDFTTKITITMKQNAVNLKAKATDVLLDTADSNVNMTPVITVTDGKNAVAVTWAQYDNGVFEVDTAEAARANWKDGQIALKVKTDVTPKAESKKADLSVIPASNKYGNDAWAAWEKANSSGEETTNDDTPVGWNVIEGTASTVKNVSVVVKKADVTGKINVESKNKTLTAANFTEKTGDKVTYEATVPYTAKIVAKVTDVTVATNAQGKKLAPEWISFKKADADNAIVIIIDKAEYVKAVMASTKNNKGQYALNGAKQRNVTATVKFSAADSKSENVAFTITPPLLEADDLVDDAIDSVTITNPSSDTKLAPGGSLNCAATVTGKSGVTLTADQQKVTWSMVTTGVKTGTRITPEGVLTIAADEDAATIKIKATSAVNITRYAEAEISIQKTEETPQS